MCTKLSSNQLLQLNIAFVLLLIWKKILKTWFFVEVKLVYTLQGKIHHYILTPFYTSVNIKQSQKKRRIYINGRLEIAISINIQSSLHLWVRDIFAPTEVRTSEKSVSKVFAEMLCADNQRVLNLYRTMCGPLDQCWSSWGTFF